jgi:hypothetical protein
MQLSEVEEAVDYATTFSFEILFRSDLGKVHEKSLSRVRNFGLLLTFLMVV